MREADAAASDGAVHVIEYGCTRAGQPVELIQLRNRRGSYMDVLTYGATIARLCVGDRNGEVSNVVLGHPDLAGYEAGESYFGAVIGRYANRIARGCFMLNGVRHQLGINNGPNALHGGPQGFHRAIWRRDATHVSDAPSVRLTHVSADGDEGYPGALRVCVTYTLTHEDEVNIDYQAAGDRTTVINLTNHSYFNLAGPRSDDILQHEVCIQADAYTPVDHTLIPTGELAPVMDTPFDFRAAKKIATHIRETHPQLVVAQGYDHNWVLNQNGPAATAGLHMAATVLDRTSGRRLEVLTTEPGVQFYSGNFLNGAIVGSEGRLYRQSAGLCLETQHFPDSPNHPHFPSTRLEAGETFRSRTVWRFSVSD